MLSFESRHHAKEFGIDTLVNAKSENFTRMMKIITNARNRPLLSQFAMGESQRKRSMRYLYRIDLLDMENLKFCYGAYMIVNHKDGIVTL